ncbi:MAG: hypothetical protein IIY32_08445, partial [Thermoguttaceae bacterium]|nr:hypothetical protein [Thermoguttaceae bacterium]
RVKACSFPVFYRRTARRHTHIGRLSFAKDKDGSNESHFISIDFGYGNSKGVQSGNGLPKQHEPQQYSKDAWGTCVPNDAYPFFSRSFKLICGKKRQRADSVYSGAFL